ncbi:hypothetical protein GA0074692_6412 [Micromonospora pallida]|uniref:Uncharacterized protein n=1 Tax=Micromonospora pallida TaxID=145854 RepID=A0A1C6TJ66_9ACTN|nr:DUF6158 family protein [Micromonospora pallida]SCL41622.1 hypothetical protein GA0074692_6412 [Micromonospora pallida]
MTGSVRQNGFPQAGATEASPEQRLPEWDGDHLHDMAVTDGGAEAELLGVDPTELGDEDLIREMHSLHRTRLDTLRHAADSALATHLRRTAELETEYLARHPGREVDPSRLRDV